MTRICPSFTPMFISLLRNIGGGGVMSESSKTEGKVRVVCPRCGYSWYTRGRLKHVTCPSCLYKVRIR
ncbi:MAG: hypothetical protein QW219_04260 [Fervidicoccaceae archaeon]